MAPPGFFRLAAVSPRTHVAAPDRNVDEILTLLEKLGDCDCIVFPELCISGYTCGDLFAAKSLLCSSLDGLLHLSDATRSLDTIIVVGLPLVVGDALYNVAAILQAGAILGFVPKTYLPNYREFYERRWFRSAREAMQKSLVINKTEIPFGADLLFKTERATIGVEICEDLWMPVPPSSLQAIAGANILLNLSASNETIGKAQWRRDLVASQSGRCLAAYAYASSGPGESTTDLVFGGHCMIAENGSILKEARTVGDNIAGSNGMVSANHYSSVIVDVDLDRLQHDRLVQNSFGDADPRINLPFRNIETSAKKRTENSLDTLLRHVSPHPFVPQADAELQQRCAEIFAIQVAGLTKRVERLPASAPLVIGVSGGLDSTLALLVAVKMCDLASIPRTRILGLTLPGFGTSAKTRSNALRLMMHLGIGSETIDIREICRDTFFAIGHHPLGVPITPGLTADSLQSSLEAIEKHNGDLVLENVQARVRTLLLMSRGFVLGTGDLSEQALGWSTYNGDHMSMYNVNTSIPKTLVRFLVRFAADYHFTGDLTAILHDIADTPISPELLPLGTGGEIAQHTEKSLGPYELHDFFLYHFVRYGMSRDKLLLLARHAVFSQAYTPAHLEEVLDIFFRRFFSQQFKRSCVPDGPKVGTVSLSPRGDWRMPSDAEVDAFISH